MNKQTIILPLIALMMAANSCIREEALGTECDITGVDSTWLAELPAGFITGNPVVKNASVTFFTPKGSDVSALAPRFYITPGASLFTKDAAGNTAPFDATQLRDFTSPQLYQVLSEDGNWKKDYTVSFETPQPTDLFNFEHFGYDERGQYQRLLQEQTDGSLNAYIWDSGNGGYALTGMAKTPEDYPTVFVEGGVSGRCAKLETKSAGDFGKRVNLPIAAGNLFIGEFRVAQAMLFPLRATRFGLQILKGEPASLSGYYKYKAGPTMTDKRQNVLAEKHDTCDIYSVVFEVDPANMKPLEGDNILSSERIVLISRIADPGEPTEWKQFEEPYRPMNGKTFDPERLKAGGYAIAVVMTSSRQGAYFEGAVGSVLYVDELKINWKE